MGSITVTATDMGDCDMDGISNADEINGPDGNPMTDDGTDPTNADTDGDGVTDGDELNGPDGNPATTADNTDPNDPCSLDIGSVTVAATDMGDCDMDLSLIHI